MLALVPDFTTVLGALLVLAMTSIFFCCFRRADSIDGKSGVYSVKEKSPSPEPNDTPSVTRCDDAVVDQDKCDDDTAVDGSDNTGTLGDFSDVQRETEILRSYRRPQAPRKKERHSRAPRVLTRSTERLLDVFGDPIEPTKDATDGIIKVNGKGPISDVKDNNAGSTQEGKDESSDVEIRDSTGNDRNKRETRSSMLLEIEQTLASLYQQQHVGDDNHEPEGNKTEEGQSLTPPEPVSGNVTDTLSSGLEGGAKKETGGELSIDGNEETGNVVSSNGGGVAAILDFKVKENSVVQNRITGTEESVALTFDQTRLEENKDKLCDDSEEKVNDVKFEHGQSEFYESESTTTLDGVSEMTKSYTSSNANQNVSSGVFPEPKLNVSTENIHPTQEKTLELTLSNTDWNAHNLKTADDEMQKISVFAETDTGTKLSENEVTSKLKKIPPKVSPKPSPKVRAKIEAAAKEAKSQANAIAIDKALEHAIASQAVDTTDVPTSPEVSPSESQAIDSSLSESLTSENKSDVDTITTETLLKPSSTDDVHISPNSSSSDSTKSISGISLTAKPVSGIPLPKSSLTVIKQAANEVSSSSVADIGELTTSSEMTVSETCMAYTNSDFSTKVSETLTQITDATSDIQPVLQQEHQQEQQQHQPALESIEICSNDTEEGKQKERFGTEDETVSLTTQVLEPTEMLCSNDTEEAKQNERCDTEDVPVSPTTPKSRIPLSPLLADKVAKKAKAESPQETSEVRGRQRKESEESKIKTSKIPVRAGSKSRSSPSKTANEDTGEAPEDTK